MRLLTLLVAAGQLVACGGRPAAPPRHRIQGTVFGTAPLEGIRVDLAGPVTATTSTSSGGDFRFEGLPDGRYAVTPSLGGHQFDPATSAIVIAGADGSCSFQKSLAPSPLHRIQGTVHGTAPLDGIRVDLAGPVTATTSTSSGGDFRFEGLPDGQYAVTPSLGGYQFDPASFAIVLAGADASCSFQKSRAPPSVWATVPGTILDAAGDRVLFMADGGPVPALRLLDRQAQQIVDVDSGAGLEVPRAFVTPQGALYVARSGPVSWEVREWRGGTSTTLGGLGAANTQLLAAGSYAAWWDGQSVHLRDLAAGAEELVTADGLAELAANGDLIVVARGCFVRHRGGSDETLQCSAGESYVSGLTTDGANYLYRLMVAFRDPVVGYVLTLMDNLVQANGTEVVFSRWMCMPDFSPGSAGCTFRGDRALVNGWVAYTLVDTPGIRLRSASGIDAQVAASGRLEALGADGSVLVTDANQRYLARSGVALQLLGPATGRPIYRDGRFLILDGSTAIEIAP